MNSPRPRRWEDLSSGDQELFARHAGNALRRRAEGFFAARRALWIDWVLTGSIGLGGLLLLDWSAATAALLLLASFWLGWIVDLVQWRMRAAALAISGQRDGDDMRVWQIVAILRGRRRQDPDVRGHPSPVLSICVDLVAGGAATALLWRGLSEAGVDLVAVATSTTVLVGGALIAAVGIGPTLRQRLRLAADGSVPLPVFSVGQRGIGLLVLVFGLMAAGGGTLAARALVGGAYGFFVLMGAIELIWGLKGLRADADWLRRQREAAGVVDAAPPADAERPEG